MGAYINPEDGEKMKWLREHAREIDVSEAKKWDGYGGPEILVCAVIAWHGHALAVGYKENEVEYWTSNSDDRRTKSFWIAPLDKVMEVSCVESYFRSPDSPWGHLKESA